MPLPAAPYGEVGDAEGAAKLEALERSDHGETVLVVDDEPTVRMLVTDILEDIGYLAIEAGDSADGVAKVKVRSLPKVEMVATEFAFETDCRDVHDALECGADFMLLDVRSPALFAVGHVPGAIKLPYGKIVRSKIEHRAVAYTLFLFEPEPDGPDMLRFEGAFCAEHSSYIPWSAVLEVWVVL